MYPTDWKMDIMTVLHKSGEKTEPGNYRGISVSSSLGKLFNKILLSRVDKYCTDNKSIHISQGSGKKKSRTSDHLMIIRFLIDKYVKKGGGELFACFIDIRKAYDSVPRWTLFYNLLTQY